MSYLLHDIFAAFSILGKGPLRHQHLPLALYESTVTHIPNVSGCLMPVQYEQVAQFDHDPGNLCAIKEPPLRFRENIATFQDHYTAKSKVCQAFAEMLHLACLQSSKYLLQPSSKVRVTVMCPIYFY